MQKTQLTSSELPTQFDSELEALLDAVPQPIIIKDERFRFRFLNEAACALVGKARNELIGRTDYDILPTAEANCIREVDKRVLRTGEQLSFEDEITVSGEGARSLVTQKRRAEFMGRDSNKKVVVATILDVTARRTAEANLRASEEHYRSLVELHPQVPWTADPSGQILEIGPRWRITGYDPADALGTGWAKAIHIDDLETVQRHWSHSIATGDPLDIEFRLATEKWGYCWFRSRAAARTGEDGSIVRWYGTVENIDDRRRALEALKESEARFRAIADDAPVMIWVRDENGAVTFRSRLWLETTGQTAEEGRGSGWANVIHPENRKTVEDGFTKAILLRKPAQMEYRLRRADGTWAWVIDIGQPRFASDGRFLGYVSIALDVTERRNAEQERLLAQRQIHYMARHDVLTGLPNRRYLGEAFECLLGDAPEGKIAVLSLDLDGLKPVNGAYGHATGDLLLCSVAERLRSCLEETDIVGRVGGGEFVIMRPGIKGDAETFRLAQKLVDALGQPYDLESTHVDVGVFVGLAFAPKDGQSADELIKVADIARARARTGGRGTCVQYEPGMAAHVQTTQQMKVSLRRAVDNGEMELHFQPLIDLRTGHVTAFEALVRWSHPVRGQVSPTEFIPLAEETGLISPLGEWILRRACTAAAEWPGHIGVAVNLSPLQFRNRRLAAVVRDILTESGVDASRLQLEITESVFLHDSEGSLQILKDMRQLGVKIAMDDFGTGYSSLGYLRTFPFDKIKADRSFIADLPTSKESLAIIRAVAGIGRTLGITTTVEGVECQMQLDLVKAEGFDEAQGYLFAHPLPAQQAMELIQSNLCQISLPREQSRYER